MIWGILLLAAGCQDSRPEPAAPTACESLPHALPFELQRPDVGTPVPTEEVSAFTRRLTGFWKQTHYFQWVLDTSHGVDESTGMAPWSVWWTGVEVVKKDGAVTFRHTEWGGPDNIMIPTSRVLAQAANGYLLTGDPVMGRIVERYSQGISATMLGFIWDENDPLRSIMARAIIPRNHSATLPDGRVKELDYSAWRQPTQAWNSNTIRVARNPYWGDLWVKNMRSQDDIPHLYTAAGWLPYVAACGMDPAVQAAAAEALRYLEGFGKDVVDSGYRIRTKDENGTVFIPDQDLASFVAYDWIIPNAQCNAKLVSAYLGYGDNQGLDCNLGLVPDFENIARTGHYYNYEISKTFHLAAILHSLLHRQDRAARTLLEGLVLRVDGDEALLDPPTDMAEWQRDLAVYLVRSAALGLPLTSQEVRLVHQQFDQALTAMAAFDKWDVWSADLPDGTFDYRPPTPMGSQEMAFFLEVCASPFRNGAGQDVVDCAVVADPARWGN